MTPDEQRLSNKVVCASFAILAAVAISPLPAMADRMGGYDLPGGGSGGYSIPERPTPPPPPPPIVEPAPPAPPTQPTPPPPRTPQPVQPQPENIVYGTFNASGPLNDHGRVFVSVDSSFTRGTMLGYSSYSQDNGQWGNDQLLVEGPAGTEHIWVDCNKEERWRSYGPNSYEFIDAVTTSWCSW